MGSVVDVFGRVGKVVVSVEVKRRGSKKARMMKSSAASRTSRTISMQARQRTRGGAQLPMFPGQDSHRCYYSAETSSTSCQAILSLHHLRPQLSNLTATNSLVLKSSPLNQLNDNYRRTHHHVVLFCHS